MVRPTAWSCFSACPETPKNDATRSLSFPKWLIKVRAVSDSEKDPLSSLLTSFALGPSWARATGDATQRASKPGAGGDSKRGDRSPRRDDRGGDDRRGGGRERDGGGRDERGRDGERKSFQGRGERPDNRRNGPPANQEILPARGVRVTLIPDVEAVHLIGKEVHQVARVYPLYDVAKILLAERARCRALFEAMEPEITFFSGKTEPSVFLSREEAVRHLWNTDLRNQFIEEETIEVDPPGGNFQLVARCGLSGEWLGPPNFHAYQINLRRLHRERYPNMPFAAYSSKVRTERGEEAVNAWLESMRRKTRWRIKGDGDDAWIDDRTEAERVLATRCFDQAFGASRTVEVNAAIPPNNLSPSLLVSLKQAGNHARNHPAVLIPAVCKAVEAEHLPVFKRQGKLFTGPARPQPLPPGVALAERPGIMVEWIRANKPAKLEGLWKAVLPEGGTAPPAEFAADLFWLLLQGHVLLFTDDTLVVQELREPAVAASPDGESKSAKKKKKKKNKQGAAATQATEAAADAGDETAEAGTTSAEETAEAVSAGQVSLEIAEDQAGDQPEDQAPEANDFSAVAEAEPDTEPAIDPEPVGSADEAAADDSPEPAADLDEESAR